MKFYVYFKQEIYLVFPEHRTLSGMLRCSNKIKSKQENI